MTSRFNKITFLLSFAGICLLVYNLVYYKSVVDDAYISFRYLDNWLAGNGLVFNPGERVEGYTNFFWIVLLSPFRLFGLSGEVASHVLSIIALALLLWSVYSTALAISNSRKAGWAAFLLGCGSVSLARWTMSGMETICFSTLLALANRQLAVQKRHSVLSSIFYSFAVLTRPTGALHVAIAFAAAIPWKVGKRAQNLKHLTLCFLIFLVMPLLHLGFRLSYYGYPFPNTFYAKLSGNLPSLIPIGIEYLVRFMVTGGIILVVLALLALIARQCYSPVFFILFLQVIFHMLYVVRVGGDYMLFSRFLVPVIPPLLVLSGIGIANTFEFLGGFGKRLLPATVFLVSLTLTFLSYQPYELKNFNTIRALRSEREIIADWLTENMSADTKIALNAVGVIPYRTGFYTIDMLGLNNLHIARAPADLTVDGQVFVGHFKHDGDYVCSLKPDIVITSGALLEPGRNREEVIIQGTANTFPGDREFLRSTSCKDFYQPVLHELMPQKFLLAFIRSDKPVLAQSRQFNPVSAEDWFREGLRMMQKARFNEAIDAFQRSFEIKPDSTCLMNLAFCYYDLQQYERAITLFERTLRMNPNQFDALYGLALAHRELGHKTEAVALWQKYIDTAPDSVWKETAKQYMDRLLR